MTLKSKYFQADRLMRQHPFSIKSPKELGTVMLKSIKGEKVLFSLSVEQNIGIKKIPQRTVCYSPQKLSDCAIS